MSGPPTLKRRHFVGTGVLAVGALAFGPGFWRQALAVDSLNDLTVTDGPYGELQDPDENGLRLPEGFESRIVARSNQLVDNSAYRWPIFPDGQATFAVDGGGWVLVTNSESLPPDAGTSAIRFDSGGDIQDAYRILGGTAANCAGGPTPWGTWLSCEEYDGGKVWECDPSRPDQGTPRPAMGVFSHEAVAVDPDDKRLYMTEDEEDGLFYRFTPANYPDLTIGELEAAVVDCGKVSWERVENPLGVPPTREQVSDASRFDGGEGIWFDGGVVYFSTKGDNVIRAYDTDKQTLEVIYDRSKLDGAPLSGLDNLTVAQSGDLYVCEDGGDMDIGIITPEGEVARFLKLTGPAAEGSEMAGVVFNPEGDRMYFNSQRGDQFGITYEVRGPFRDLDGSGPRGPVLECDDPTKGEDDQDDDDPDRSEEDVRRDDGRGFEGDPRGGDRDRDDDRDRNDDRDRDDGGDGVAPPPLAPADVDAPGLVTTARRALPLGTLLENGLNVEVRVDEPSSIKVALTTGDLARVAGARGSTPRPRTTRLALAARTVAVPGGYTLRLRPSRRMAARLRSIRRSSLVGTVTTQATDRAGNVAVATRRVRIPLRS